MLFEAEENEVRHRVQILDAADNLIRKSLLEATGGDFCSLTEEGKRMVLFLTCQGETNVDCHRKCVHLCTVKY